jgi:hypothetical protein
MGGDEMTEHWSDMLTRLNACADAIEWARTQESYESAWRTCAHGNWMLWLLAKAGARREDVVLAACACARQALRYVPKGEERPRIAIETAERWARGEATIEEVRAADAAADAHAAARDRSLAESADIVRAQFPTPPEVTK